jgi:hypothetical protein
MEKIKILFLAANPDGTDKIDLAREARTIEERLQAAEHRDSLELITKWAVRPDDLLQALNRHQPHVVHFSAHGEPTDGILLEGPDGKAQPVSGDALHALFGVLKDNVRLVVLNACYLSDQADAITEHIDCAIGMTRAVPDEAAIDFAASLYRAIGFGRSVKNAFDQGVVSLKLKGIGGDDMPILHQRDGADAADVVLIEPDVDADTIRATEPIADDDSGTNIDSAAAKIWKEKIAFLNRELAITADASQKFSIEQKIQEAKKKIAELTG